MQENSTQALKHKNGIIVPISGNPYTRDFQNLGIRMGENITLYCFVHILFPIQCLLDNMCTELNGLLNDLIQFIY